MPMFEKSSSRKEVQQRSPAGTVRRAWIVFALVAGALLAGGLYLSGEVFRERAFSTLREDALNDAGLKGALLRAVLERPRALPLVLADDAELRSALFEGSDGAVARLDRKLQQLVEVTKVAVIYVIRPDGIAMAASNWNEPDSFVGRDYGFREYFQRAVAEGGAEHYALGTVSKRPGLYISRRVEGADGKLLGVVVVKVEFDGLEQDWGRSGKPTFVTDRHGIVLVTSRPEWRFLAIHTLDEAERGRIRESLQFGEAPLEPVPVTAGDLARDGTLVSIVPTGGKSAAEFLSTVTPVADTPWQLHLLTPAETTLNAAAWQGRLQALAGLTPLVGGAALLLYRWQRAVRRQASERAARDQLERKVAERTEELSRARDRLQTEIAEHHATETRLQTVQQELVQANRLAILGQVAAGVAHEINQPVATIRAYADNAATFLSRGQSAPAAENLSFIAGLTERIGAITDELRTFARKGRAAAEPVELATVVEGALLLLRSRFSGRLDMLHVAAIPRNVKVLGNRVRLEQVLINLLQNALEAMADRPDGRIDVRWSETQDGRAVVSVSDNGPGITPEILENLFTPFNTSKEGGLGLGLVISKDIVDDYGGTLTVESGPAGTTFTVTLKKAER
ncbi:sensor histidine kinase [Rhizobium sp. S-51]|uniref:C4-dicarboxylate transport sensor protein n=2 Tax=Rhizobium terricola TaxID=2728849 RepID=A0A7Y0ASJ6_9HYPH|nr:sensor histidine kinase [Rhizobium terricola]